LTPHADRPEINVIESNLAELRSPVCRYRYDAPGEPRFPETDAGPDVLAFWREADGDRTLTLLGASSTQLPAITVRLPGDASGRPDAWLLGEGTVPERESRTLRAGPLQPFESKVIRWGDQP
jgi:hypothetical protein